MPLDDFQDLLHQRKRQSWVLLLEYMALNERRVNYLKGYTNSLYWFTLKPRATSSSQKPLGNPLSNQYRLHTKPPKK